MEPETPQTLSNNLHNSLTMKNLISYTVPEHLAHLGIVVTGAPEDLHRHVAGRLQYFLHNWQVVTKDQWILQTIQGAELEFSQAPIQRQIPHPPHLSAQDRALLWEEVTKLKEKGAIQELSPSQEKLQTGFFSNLFLVPKKDGSARPVINLRALNQFIPMEHFKMEGMQTLRDLLRQGDWLTKVDLKDAYFSIPIAPEYQRYLRFTVENHYFQFTCLPFGLSSTPWVFTKTLKPVTALLRELGVRLIQYLDDFLVMASSPQLANEHTNALILLLKNLGFSPPRKVSHNTIPKTGIPGHDGQFPEHGTPSPRREAQEDQVRSMVSGQVATDVSTTDLSHSGQDECSDPGHSPCSTVLQSPAEGLIQGIGTWEPELRHSMCRIPGGPRGVRVVDFPLRTVEWQKPGSPSTGPDNSVRCLPQRVGSDFSGSKNRWLLVSRGEPVPHKLPRDIGSQLSDKVLPKAQVRPISACLDRQHNHGIIPEPPGRDSVTKGNQDYKGLMDVVPPAEHHLESSTSPREREYNSGRGIPRYEGQIRLDAEPLNLPKDPEETGPSPSGSLCITPDGAVTSFLLHFFSWRPDPLATATDALLQDWSRMRAYANPPWNLIGRVLTKIQSSNPDLILLVAPIWPSQPWYPTLLELLVDFPRLLPHQQDLYLYTEGMNLPEICLDLAVWPISANGLRQRSFQRKLPISSWLHGGRRQQSPTTCCFRSGLAGVRNGAQIPFQAL